VIVVVGLSHRSAPVEVRERLAVAPADLAQRLADLKQRTRAGEMVMLCTCNRVEVIAAIEPGGTQTPGELGASIVDALEAVAPKVRPHLYVRDDRAGI